MSEKMESNAATFRPSNDGRKGQGSIFSLRSSRLLAGLSEDGRARIEKICEWRDFDAGDKIIGIGDSTRDVYFIVAGQVNVLNFTASGRVVAFASLGPGHHFGELAAIDGQPRSATVVATRPSRIAIFSADQFKEIIAGSPDIAFRLLQEMAQVIRNCDSRIFNLSALDTSQRVCVELLRLAEPDPGGSGGWVIYPVPTQAAVAGNIGSTRETVARMFRWLSSHGIIERKSKVLHIRDRRGLEERAMSLEETG
jgi:CRP/FNR family transcriptional regulator, cyclic AMP receptor protein